MPREAPKPAAFEPQWLQRSLDRHYTWGLVFMVVLILGFLLYGIQEPTLRARATREQQGTYTHLGSGLFANNCAACHGRAGIGGSAPTLNSKQFLTSTSDQHARLEPRLRWPAHRRADPPARRLPPLIGAGRAQRPKLAARQALSRSGFPSSAGHNPRRSCNTSADGDPIAECGHGADPAARRARSSPEPIDTAARRRSGS
jgi:Cytochrome c